MAEERSPYTRPYWHKDAQWIAGLLLVVVLGLAMLVYSLVEITDERPAVDAVSTSLALLFSPKGLDDETEIAQLRQLLGANGGSAQPIPGLRVTALEQEIQGLSPRQVRLYLFRQVAQVYYQQGSQGAAALADTPELRRAITGAVGFLGLFTLETHQNLHGALIPLGLISLLLLIPLVLFSARFGRLGSVGVVLLAAGLPGALLSSVAAEALQGFSGPLLGGMGVTIGTQLGGVAPPLLRIMADGYRQWVKLGAALVAIAVLADLAWWGVLKLRKRPDEEATTQTERHEGARSEDFL